MENPEPEGEDICFGIRIVCWWILERGEFPRSDILNPRKGADILDYWCCEYPHAESMAGGIYIRETTILDFGSSLVPVKGLLLRAPRSRLLVSSSGNSASAGLWTNLVAAMA